MPPRQRFYDPLVERDPEPRPLSPVRGMIVEVPGVYVLAADVETFLARTAQEFHGEGREALQLAAEAFSQMTAVGAGDAPEEPQEAVPDVSLGFVHQDGTVQTLVDWIEDGTPVTDGSRIELYQDPSRPEEEAPQYWNARLVNGEGHLLAEGVQGVNQDDVIRRAGETWPGRMVHLVHGPLGDSRWDETESSVAFNGQRRPSTQRLFGR